ncbi:MAG: Fic family protein, partial [archaeon]|nr:Fic family protein [archaeon]
RGSRTQMRRSGQAHSEVVNGRPVYSAPHGENVPALMDQFVEFLSNSTCVDELVKSCMALLMFEAVSPFGEYSGRVGRAMLVSLLEHYGLAQGHCVLVSPYLAEHRDEYVQVLREAEMSGRSQGFILFMLRAIREGAFRTMQKLFTVDLVYVDVKEEMADSTLCNDALLNTIFEGIYCKSSNLIRNGIAERVTAMKYLRSLEEMGVLESEKVGREVVFKNVALYDALTR